MMNSTFHTASRTMVLTAILQSRASFQRVYSLRESKILQRTQSSMNAQAPTHASQGRKRWSSSSSAATTIQKLISDETNFEKGTFGCPFSMMVTSSVYQLKFYRYYCSDGLIGIRL